MSSIEHALRLVLSTGRVHLGSKQTIREVKRGRAQLAILSNNCPEETREKVEALSKLSDTPIMNLDKDSIDLGVMCGKHFPVSAIVINDTGDSKILELLED
ncbi:MAG: 50S ribosomal protein L30e [Candidatus Bathyarchaeia archaeon]